MSNGVTPEGFKIHPFKVGYVIIPKDVDREEYIKTCKQSGTVCAVTEEGAFYRDIRVNKADLDLGTIIFPSDYVSYGSVLWLAFKELSSIPVVLGVFNLNDSQSTNIEEFSFSLYRGFDANNYVNVSGSAIDDVLNVNIKGESPKLTVSCIGENENETSLDIETNGTCNVKGKEVNISTIEDCVVSVLNERRAIFSKGSVKMLANSVTSSVSENKSVEKAIKGESFISVFNDTLLLVEAQAKFLIALGFPDATAQFTAIRNKLLDVYSDSFKTD